MDDTNSTIALEKSSSKQPSKWDPDSMHVSFLRRANDSNTSQCLSVREVHQRITSGMYRTKILEIREGRESARAKSGEELKSAEERIRSMKEELPAVMWSGTFKKRGDANLDTYSGLVCADLDHLEGKRSNRLFGQFRNHPYAVLGFRSPSGAGLKVVFRVAGDGGHHADNCSPVEKHLRETYRLEAEVDPSYMTAHK